MIFFLTGLLIGGTVGLFVCSLFNETAPREQAAKAGCQTCYDWVMAERDEQARSIRK